MVPHPRYEKEFEQVNDVFELQVCPILHSLEANGCRWTLGCGGRRGGIGSGTWGIGARASIGITLLTPTRPQRNLNNAFAYDLVPAPSVIEAALKAARRVNDFATAVRVFEGAA